MSPLGLTDPWVILNGVAQRASQVAISPLCAGFQLGHGVSTALRVAEGKLTFFQDHQRRIISDASAIGLSAPSAAELLTQCRDCVARNEVVDGALKIVIFRDLQDSSVLVAPRPPSPLLPLRERGCRLKTVLGPAGGAATLGHKTTSYLAHTLARQSAQEQGYHEALWVNALGEPLETAGANIFIVRGKTALTPPDTAGLLPGIVRAALLLHSPNTQEAVIRPEMLVTASEVFITNSLIGVMPVAAIDGREWDVSRYTVTPALAQLLREVELLTY